MGHVKNVIASRGVKTRSTKSEDISGQNVGADIIKGLVLMGEKAHYLKPSYNHETLEFLHHFLPEESLADGTTPAERARIALQALAAQKGNFEIQSLIEDMNGFTVPRGNLSQEQLADIHEALDKQMQKLDNTFFILRKPLDSKDYDALRRDVLKGPLNDEFSSQERVFNDSARNKTHLVSSKDVMTLIAVKEGLNISDKTITGRVEQIFQALFPETMRPAFKDEENSPELNPEVQQQAAMILLALKESNPNMNTRVHLPRSLRRAGGLSSFSYPDEILPKLHEWVDTMASPHEHYLLEPRDDKDYYRLAIAAEVPMKLPSPTIFKNVSQNEVDPLWSKDVDPDINDAVQALFSLVKFSIPQITPDRFRLVDTDKHAHLQIDLYPYEMHIMGGMLKNSGLPEFVKDASQKGGEDGAYYRAYTIDIEKIAYSKKLKGRLDSIANAASQQVSLNRRG